MRRSLASAVALAASALLLIGCTSAPSSTGPSTAPAAAPSPTPSATAEIEPQIVVSLDGIAVTDESGTRRADFADLDAVLNLVGEVAGGLPEPEKVEDPPGYEYGMVNYTWDGLKVFTDTAHEAPASVAITGSSLNGVPIMTEQGVAVGSTREELIDAGAWALVDAEDPRTAEFVGVGGREAPGTESLTHPGSVGIIFTLFWFDGDVVKQIQVPSNDYSDI
ncbi:hypothetical protein [Microbacterium maritypicum]|uniref:hypothetical protein n=1 Tax=Microbacterium maritypicum TaxID=33918 RepID=UPI0037FF5CA3